MPRNGWQRLPSVLAGKPDQSFGPSSHMCCSSRLAPPSLIHDSIRVGLFDQPAHWARGGHEPQHSANNIVLALEKVLLN